MVASSIDNTLGSSIRQQICQILNIEDHLAWLILSTSENGDLALVHFVEGAPGWERFIHLDGTIVSTFKKVIVANCFGPNYKSVATQPLIDGENTVIDDDGNTHRFTPDESLIYRGNDGVLLRMIYWDGKVYLSTRRKIDASNSCWGNETISFTQMFKELGGPATLFGNGKYSNQCHSFVVVHEQLASASRQKVQPGVLIYLGAETCWNPIEVDIEMDELDTNPDLSALDDLVNVPGNLADVQQPAILNSVEISVEEANDYLGFNAPKVEDPRLGAGEFILVYYENEDGQFVTLRMESHGYKYREKIHGTGRNLTHRCVKLYEYRPGPKNRDISIEQYHSMFATISPTVLDGLQERLEAGESFTEIPTEQEETTPASELNYAQNIWLNLLFCVAPHRQLEVYRLQNSFTKMKELVVDWIFQLAITKTSEQLAQMRQVNGLLNFKRADRLIFIIENNVKYARDHYRPRTGAKNKDYNDFLKNVFIRSINREQSGNVYNFFKARSRYYRTLDDQKTRVEIEA